MWTSAGMEWLAVLIYVSTLGEVISVIAKLVITYKLTVLPANNLVGNIHISKFIILKLSTTVILKFFSIPTNLDGPSLGMYV